MRKLLPILAAALLAACTTPMEQETNLLNGPTAAATAAAGRGIALASFAGRGHALYFQQQGSSVMDPRMVRLTPETSYGGLPAGSYALSHFEVPAFTWRQVGGALTYRVGGWANPVVTFEVAPGEAVYLGHVEVDAGGETVGLRVVDQYHAFRATLPPELGARLQKRLLVVPPSLRFKMTVTRSY